MHKSEPGPGRANREAIETVVPTGGQPGPDAQASAPAAGGGDAPPSNTASQSCKDGEKILRYGVDSLYVSYDGELDPTTEYHLAEKKLLAQSRNPDQKKAAQWEAAGHIFEVYERGQRGFEYILEDNAFRICFASSEARNMPMAYVKVSSEYLAHKGPEAAVDDLTAIIALFGNTFPYPSPSRIDLFVDFQTRADLESIVRQAWVTRARYFSSYAEHGTFTGWAIGQGSSMSMRLYQKTIEALKTNKTWLFPLWQRAGMEPDSPVWRLEIQVRREVLGQLGIRSWVSTLDRLGGWASPVFTDTTVSFSKPSQTDRD